MKEVLKAFALFIVILAIVFIGADLIGISPRDIHGGKAADIAAGAMALGVALILFQLAITGFVYVATAAGLKPGDGEIGTQNASKFWETLQEIGKKLPFAVLGVLLVLIAAVLVGGIDANLVLGGADASPSPSATPSSAPTPVPSASPSPTAG